MKLNELFAKVVGLDSAKEYDIVEMQEPQVVNQQMPTTPALDMNALREQIRKEILAEQQPQVQQQNSSTVEQQLQQLTERNKVLEAANFALLQKMPVNEPVKSFDENVLEIVGGNIYGDIQNRTKS